MSKQHRWAIAFLGLSFLLQLGSPAHAAELDPYLPEDTEAVIILNFRQLLTSKLVKEQVGLETIRAQLLQDKDVASMLKNLGLDPLKDIDRVVIGQPSSAGDDQGLIIVRGKFAPEKIHTTLGKFAKDDESIEMQKVKDLKGKEHTVYKVTNPELPTSLYVGVAGEKAILIGMSKDYLLDGLQVNPNGKARLKNKIFSQALAKLDDNQSLAMGFLGKVLVEGFKGAGEQGITVPESIVNVFKEMDAVMGGITIDDGIKVRFSLAAKTAKAAKDINLQITQGLNQGKLLLTFLVMQEPQLQPLADFVNSVRVSVSENVVTLKGGIDGEDLKKLIPRDQ